GISKDSFVDSDLKDHFSDILYKVGLESGGQACIYVLFEHKSYEDKLAAFQILKYMVKIWDQQRQQNKEQKTKQKYPLKPIFPVLVYHGPTGWQVELSFAALFDKTDLPDVLRPYIPDYKYWLWDLSQYSDEAIKGEVILRLSALLLKYIYRDDLLTELGRILQLLIEVQPKETGLEYIETVLRYLTSGTDKVTEAELSKILKEVYAEGEKLMPTIAQQWVEQGIAIGEKQGLQKGRQEGHQAMVEMLYQTLIIRFGVVLGDYDERFESLDLKSLKELSKVALTAQTLAEFEQALTDMASTPETTSPRSDNGEEQEKPDL
ncbi:MAG: Rpn family recombination-promoting nuclease/putative transposase, partial [Cytophagales bacterium]|nr:Rpn family recombination-promoting nuclease/putative transposase [Cytophagales bacterium]